jgi:hypothetical protein
MCLRIPTNDIKSPRRVWLSSTADFVMSDPAAMQSRVCHQTTVKPLLGLFIANNVKSVASDCLLPNNVKNVAWFVYCEQRKKRCFGLYVSPFRDGRVSDDACLV